MQRKGVRADPKARGGGTGLKGAGRKKENSTRKRHLGSLLKQCCWPMLGEGGILLVRQPVAIKTLLKAEAEGCSDGRCADVERIYRKAWKMGGATREWGVCGGGKGQITGNPPKGKGSLRARLESIRANPFNVR